MREFMPPLLLILAALVLLLIASRLFAKSGLPKGKVVYADTDQWQRVPEPLYDPQLNLVGKPDYVVALKDGSLVPVEVKSMNAPQTPYDSHVIQLAAYGYLLEATRDKKPAYGLLKYADKTFQVDFPPELESELVWLIGEVRSAEALREAPPRSHEEPARCRGCGYRENCEDRLV